MPILFMWYGASLPISFRNPHQDGNDEKKVLQVWQLDI